VTRPLLLLAEVTAQATPLESVPYDWAALQLTRLGATAGVAALGFAGFMAGMRAARLAGERLSPRWLALALSRFGLVLPTAGFVVPAASTHPASFIAGLAVAGVGSSWFFPLAYAAAARIPGVAPGTGAATVSLACRIGLLVEPIVVGALADLAGLRWGFALVAVLAAALGLAASRIIPSTTDPSRQGPDLVKL
jgi:MFS family permease